jgi:hypothetical protein
MNTTRKQVFSGGKPLKMKLILWIILTLLASIGAYLANYALIFHLKSAIFSWFGVWFALFGLAFKFWTKGLSLEDRNKGPYSITAIPEILSEVLIILGVFFYTVNIYFILGWIFIYPFYINLRSTKTNQKIYRPTINFLANYIETQGRTNFKLAFKLTSLDFLTTSTSFLIIDGIREFSVFKRIQPNNLAWFMFVVALATFVLSKISSKPKKYKATSTD